MNDKEKLGNKLILDQKKLVEIIQEEESLSKQVPLNETQLKKKAKARYETMNKINDTALALLDMGLTFKIRRKKKTG